MAHPLRLRDSGDRKRRDNELWLSRDDIDPVESPPGGAVVDLLDSQGEFRGRGFYSSSAPTAVRVISNGKTAVDRSFFRRRIRRAIQWRRRSMGDRPSYRLVNSDGDFLPGLIVDRYGPVLVAQFRTQSMDQFASLVYDVLEEELDPDSIYLRNDVEAREREGLEQYRGLARGEPVPDRLEIFHHPYRVVADVKTGQKTGYFLDQQQNRDRLQLLVSDATCLDCFCYSGGWGLAALQGGANQVHFVDQSEDALELARENVQLNGWEDRSSFQQADGFDYLNESSQGETPFDLVVLDPPAFASGEEHFTAARRAYKEINLRAMQILKPRGILATSSCSAPMTMEKFSECLVDSAHDAHVIARAFQKHHQGSDHCWLANLPRSQYLHCVFCEITLL